jgi:hypothetical protein
MATCAQGLRDRSIGCRDGRVMFWRKKPPAQAPAPLPPPPPEVPLPDGVEEPEEPRYWIERLAMRAARLQRLREIKAPQNIIDQEHRLIGTAIAMLTPEEALAAIARATELARHFAREVDSGQKPEGDAAPPN